MPINEFLMLLDSTNKIPSKSPYSFLIEELTLKGTTEKDQCNFECDFKVLIFTNEWVKVPLIPNSVPIQKYSITFQGILSSKPNEKVETSELKITEENETSGFIGVVDQYHSLVTDKRGCYNISISFYSSYISKEKSGVSILFASKALKNKLLFSVENRKELLIKVEPGTDMKQTEKKKESTFITQIEGHFPSINNLKIHWTVKDPLIKKEEKIEIKKPLQVTGEQQTLHSIGGGICSTITELTFEILNGTLNTFSIQVDYSENKFRLLRVEGDSIKNWEFITKDEKRFIRVYLISGVEGTYHLRVISETEMKETDQLSLPTFSCLNIQREKGFIGIEQTQNIEIKELNSSKLQKIDTSELPKKMSDRVSNSILLAYKFLSSDYSLKLDVIKHDDVAVLVAFIEEAYFEVTYSSGKVLHHILLSIKNTNQDFLKFLLPKNAELWSTLVDEDAVRPAIDKTGRILIPLKRSTKESIFSAEIVYLMPCNEMKGSGDISIEFPIFNTIINQAYYSIFLPKDFKYGEFQGLKELESFSKTPKFEQVQERSIKPSFGNNSLKMTQMNSNILQPQQQRVNIPKSVKSLESGVMPVDLSRLPFGQRFKFEKLVISESSDPVKLSVTFKENSKPFYLKRSLFPWKKLFYFFIFSGLFFIISYFIYKYSK